MNNFKANEERVYSFLKTMKLEPLRFSKEELKASKTPEFRVYKDGKLICYCEVKSIFDDNFEGVRPDPTYNTIQNKIHEAVKQFDSVNPFHDYPNVLAFCKS